ncbi:hypothetical protein [Bacteroides sp.]|uniref:hypothetical protein n=1 Tax=Bacteroides sp. TaxID=29523 RepID=UPI0025BE3A36|nr:hypothetical protein [Bacteroides sp.]
MIGISTDSIQLAKDRKIDCIDGWINALAILVYIDIFLGVLQQQGEQVDKVLDNFTIGYLIQFIVGAIFCILVVKFLTILLYILYLGVIAEYVEKLVSFRERQDSAVSIYKLKEYAMMNNNDVVARIADEAEKKETKYLRNTLVKVGTIILICFDFYYGGAYIPNIISDPSTHLVIVIACILICIGLLQSLYEREAQVFIFSDELRKKIVGRNKSIIDDV